MAMTNDDEAPSGLTLRVYQVDRSGRRSEPREVHPEGGSMFALGRPWPLCTCPRCRGSEAFAERVSAAERRAGL